MSGLKIFVPVDAAARGVGADETARAIAAEAQRRQIDIEIIRNGSRGLLWLEPLVEVEVAGQRMPTGRYRPIKWPIYSRRDLLRRPCRRAAIPWRTD